MIGWQARSQCMILPTPGADPASRLFGYATPPDGAGPIGPDQLWPTPITVSREEALRGLNPLHHIPIVGTIYRAVTGETIPAPMRVLGAGLIGGPLGALGAGFMGLIEGLLSMKPDLSRPSVPAGMSATGGEIGMEPVSPGSLTAGAYTTLATTAPEWLTAGNTQYAAVESGRGCDAYQQASLEWRRSEALEKGMT
ncbi:MAG: hypothetical protein ACRYGM_27590 [Janthinobacterium lividum]